MQAPVGKGEQKKWLPSNFRLKIDGLDNACPQVNKIEAITIKQKVVEDPGRRAARLPEGAGELEYPNLVITFAESHADAARTSGTRTS